MMRLLPLFLSFLYFLDANSLELKPASETNPMSWTQFVLSTNELKAGERVFAKIDLTLLKGFYAYDDKIKIFPLAPDGLRIGDIKITPLQKFTDFSGKPHQGIVEKATLEFFLELPKDLQPQARDVVLDLEYIACTPKFCLPKHKIEVKAYFSPIEKNIDINSIEGQISHNIYWAFVLVFFFGFLTSLTPCVYPLIPITLAVIGARSKNSSKMQAFSLSFVYVLGIAVTYSLLGVLAAQTGALFGQALSYPPVILFFVALFLLMALSIFGFFEIQIPLFISQRLSKTKTEVGYLGAFTTGLIAGVIASPCVGPVLVGVLAYIAKSQNVFLGFGLLFTFAMGLGVLLLLIGTFSSFFQKLPKSGVWMDLVKFILGTTLLVMALYYMRHLMPSSWFSISVMFLLLAAVFSFFIQVYPLFSSRNFRWLPLLFCVLAFLSPLVFQFQKEQTGSQKMYLKEGWNAYSEELLEQARHEKKPVIIDFFADWCAACVELDEKTFSTEKFKTSAKNFMWLKVDATESSVELAALEKKFKIYGLPTIIFIDSSGEVRADLTLTGFEEIDPFLSRIQPLIKGQ